MSDTHINAFYMNVDEKKAALETAKADLTTAEEQLKTKQAELKAEEPKQPKQAEPRKVNRSAKNNKKAVKKSPATTVTSTAYSRTIPVSTK